MSRLKITATTFKDDFGTESLFYKDAFRVLTSLISKQKENGSEDIPSINQVYLMILAKLVLIVRFSQNQLRRQNILKMVFDESITKLFKYDPTKWLLSSSNIDFLKPIIDQMRNRLNEYDIATVNEDIFTLIYENFFKRDSRVKTGAYYTPKWLVQLVIKETIATWNKEKEQPSPTILDPACGSGSFIFAVISFLKKKGCKVSQITERVIGFEINQIASNLARVNYLLALGDLLKDIDFPSIPVYTTNSLFPNKNFEMNRFDIIVGNPPWIVMRSISSEAYQKLLKQEVLRLHLLQKNDLHLFTQLEMATLFFNKCIDLYLKVGGVISFLMPRSVIGGTYQHALFRTFSHPKVRLLKIIDLEDVKPLFKIPSCVLIAENGNKTIYPVPLVKLTAFLTGHQELKTFTKISTTERLSYSPPDLRGVRSYYYNEFRTGASVFPRCFFFMDALSRDNNLLTVKTSKEVLKTSKKPWNILFEGKIEDDYIYSTLLAKHIIPFGYKKLSLIILPITAAGDYFRFVEIGPEKIHHEYLKIWMEFVESNWKMLRTRKSASRFPSIKDRINYNKLLEYQQARENFTVLFNATGKDLVSCIIDNSTCHPIETNGIFLDPHGFIVDVKTWYYKTNDEMEAYYLSSILNSRLLNDLIKPLQPKGLGGPRAIHRRPLLFPIPKFDENDENHVKLARLGERCHSIMKTDRNTNITRKEARKKIKTEIKQIEKLVQNLL